MTCLALRACLLVRLHARSGEWVPLADLVAHFGRPAPVVQAECQALVCLGQAVHVALPAGHCYGVRVEGVKP